MHPLSPSQTFRNISIFWSENDRAVWQKPDTVVKELQLSGMEKIADVGAGSGYFTFRLARAVPRGMVYAIDTEPEMLRHIHHRALSEGVHNIEIIKSDSRMIPQSPQMLIWFLSAIRSTT